MAGAAFSGLGLTIFKRSRKNRRLAAGGGGADYQKEETRIARLWVSLTSRIRPASLRTPRTIIESRRAVRGAFRMTQVLGIPGCGEGA